jgi:hypothetical protein
MGADRRLGEIGQARKHLLLTVASYHNPVKTPGGGVVHSDTEGDDLGNRNLAHRVIGNIHRYFEGALDRGLTAFGPGCLVCFNMMPTDSFLVDDRGRDREISRIRCAALSENDEQKWLRTTKLTTSAIASARKRAWQKGRPLPMAPADRYTPRTEDAARQA